MDANGELIALYVYGRNYKRRLYGKILKGNRFAIARSVNGGVTFRAIFATDSKAELKLYVDATIGTGTKWVESVSRVVLLGENTFGSIRRYTVNDGTSQRARNLI